MENETREQQQQKLERIVKRKLGPPFGNQNARTHGFYSKVLTKNERRAFEKAISIDDIDAEIALIRIKIKSLLDTQPDNVKLISQALNTLARLVSTKQGIGGGTADKYTQATMNLLRDVAIPAGVPIEQVFKQ